VAAVRTALQQPEDIQKRSERQQAVRNDSWDQRARELDRHLRELGCHYTSSRA